jgi:hypothetical protein
MVMKHIGCQIENSRLINVKTGETETAFVRGIYRKWITYHSFVILIFNPIYHVLLMLDHWSVTFVCRSTWASWIINNQWRMQ